MEEALGKIEKPEAKSYKGKRIIYFIPLIFIPKDDELLKIVNRYWEEVRAKLLDLEEKVEGVKRIYYALIPVGGKEGLKIIEEFKAGYQIIKDRVDKGATLEVIEDKELLTEFMDWRRCLSIGLQNQKVLNIISKHYEDVQEKRYEYISKRIDETLKANEAGMLLMEEEHQIQFSKDVNVFYILPPSLEELKQSLRRKHLKTEVE